MGVNMLSALLKVKRLPHCKASEKEINRLEYSSSIRNLPLLVCLVVCAKPLRYECNLFLLLLLLLLLLVFLLIPFSSYRA
uniref:Uncharacterized protein n=1 Tax=Glossina palpalis gambiensis TaxID=67801 RepID=A0A1B0AZP5_9MUSC